MYALISLGKPNPIKAGQESSPVILKIELGNFHSGFCWYDIETKHAELRNACTFLESIQANPMDKSDPQWVMDACFQAGWIFLKRPAIRAISKQGKVVPEAQNTNKGLGSLSSPLVKGILEVMVSLAVTQFGWPGERIEANYFLVGTKTTVPCS